MSAPHYTARIHILDNAPSDNPPAGSVYVFAEGGKLKQRDSAGLVTDFTAGVPTSRQVATQHSLEGGGDLTANRTLSLVGDTASPGAHRHYRTNAAGDREWGQDAMVPLGVWEVSSAAALIADHVFDASLYDHYIIRLSILPASSNVSLIARLRDGTPADVVTVRRTAGALVSMVSTDTTLSTNSGTLFGVVSNDSARVTEVIMTLMMRAGAPHSAYVDAHRGTAAATTHVAMRSACDWNDTTPRQGIKFDFSSGNVATGRMSIWGVTKQPI